MTATAPTHARARRSTRARASRARSRRCCTTPQDALDTGDVLTVNFGPNHPSTHGVLRLIVDLDGEDVVGLAAVIGYLHTGFEKNMEQKTWWKAITVPGADRLRLLPGQRATSSCCAIEKLLELEVPREGDVDAHAACCELNRIHSHLVWLGTSALELGAISMFWYAFRERDAILDLFEMVAGYAHAHALLPGRRARRGHPARASTPRRASSATWMPKRDRRVRDAARRATRSGSSARRASACSRPTTRSRSASPGPVLRASGVDWDLRKVEPYLAYDQVDFDVPVYPEGDVYARYRVHMDGDARVGAHRRAVPRPARAHGGRAVDRRRPQGRAAAARTSSTPRWSR